MLRHEINWSLYWNWIYQSNHCRDKNTENELHREQYSDSFKMQILIILKIERMNYFLEYLDMKERHECHRLAEHVSFYSNDWHQTIQRKYYA